MERWRKAFTYSIDARGVKESRQQKVLLLHTAGMDFQNIFETLTDPSHPERTSPDPHNEFQKAVRTLDSHFVPKINAPYERHLFHRVEPKDSETVEQYVARLRAEGKLCEYGDSLHEHIRDQLLYTCKSMSLRKELLGEGSSLTLDKSLELARTVEAVDLQATTMNQTGREETKSDVNRVENRGRKLTPEAREGPKGIDAINADSKGALPKMGFVTRRVEDLPT